MHKLFAVPPPDPDEDREPETNQGEAVPPIPQHLDLFEDAEPDASPTPENPNQNPMEK